MASGRPMTTKLTKPKPDIARAEAAIAKLAAAYPEVREDRPWGHSAFKVLGKTFLFLYADGDGLSVSVKLPQSGKRALERAFVEPTHYGLGKSGWVTARVATAQELPLALVKEWLRESFQAIAPKKISAALASTAKPAKVAKPAKAGKPAKVAIKSVKHASPAKRDKRSARRPAT
jgi:predicted DNA-binding protein (MmcQ/YjbR family)